MISFDYLPATLRIPGTYVEFAPGERGPLDIDQKLLLIGQKTASGTATVENPVLLTHPDQADGYFGKGSQLARMFRTAYKNNSYTETWALPLDDASSGVAATGNILFAGGVTKAGALNLYIGGEKVAIAAAAEDTPAEVATAITAAINAETNLPVTAAVNGETPEQVDITAKNKGELGNDIDLRHSYYVQETLPAGLTCTITAMTGGGNNPDITDALAAISGLNYDYFCMPYSDTANLALLRDELENRWSWQVQTYGHGFVAAKGTVAELQALGNSQNSQHLSIMGAGKSPSPPECWAAACAAIAAYYLNQDPARPLQTLELKGLKAPDHTEVFSSVERDLLLHDGVSTYYLSSDSKVLIEALITTYQENAFGAPDTAYLYANTPCILSYVAQSLVAYLTSKFARHKLTDDGGPTPPTGMRIATPALVRAEAIECLTKLYETKGVVEHPSVYEEQITAERDGSDTSRVNLLLPVQLIGQLRRNFIRIEHT
jgi:phage tail sheath gpL-like